VDRQSVGLLKFLRGNKKRRRLFECRRRWDVAPAGELAELPGELLLNCYLDRGVQRVADGSYPAKVRMEQWGRFITGD
jgi:hypothetical protein